MTLRLTDLDYELPADRIAQAPAAEREQARLMVLDRARGTIEHRHVAELPEELPPGGLVVVNDTRVFKARLRGRRDTGGAVELLLLKRGTDGCWTAMGRANRPLRPGTRVMFGPTFQATVLGRDEAGILRLRLEHDAPTESSAIDAHGEVPLPPYVRRRANPADAERYQTVYARVPGAVAAPTAGLHLTEALLERARAKGIGVRAVTLHVGAGTFAPVTAARLDEHPMHAEWYEIPTDTALAIEEARRAGRPVVAVGTTVVRTLESAIDEAGSVRSGPGETRLLIQPGYRFRCVDQLLTNFHVPRSTLIALVMAFATRERILDAYAQAVRAGYLFFSYGDAMLLR